MRRITALIALPAAAALGLLAVAQGQEGSPDKTDAEKVVEARLLGLEQTVARLNTQLQMRTEVAGGPQDRVSRDFNLEQRLNNIERQVQQLGIQVSNLDRLVQSASQAAMQAQNDARQAQQMARDASFR